ncbi:MAG: sortase [Candidatus Peribacteraceae bacterium]|nr:sortase [Candidatus Peribacteraceae bacterium]
MLNPSFPHRAWYDDDGNIILPGFTRASEPEVREVRREPSPRREIPIPENIEWIIIEDNPEALHKLDGVPEISPAMSVNLPPRIPMRIHVQERIVAVRRITRGAVREGAKQYRVSINAGQPLLERAKDDLVWLRRVTWNFLAQPVWVPTRRREIKQYSRGTLFTLDILRFGGTFAVIFLGLFVALNYDSFWQITRSNISVILSSPSIESAGDGADDALIETLKQTAAQSVDGRERGELISFLPTVGPPDNRILIPKLSLNVPLVTPPLDSLLKQDWTQVETDIQSALADGVVHYPGTARPGQAGNFFVTGHSSYYPWAPGKYKTVFARLPQLAIGDEYWVYYKGDRHRYLVTSKKEVSPSDVSVLDQPENKRISTLMTCTPIGTTLRRLIVQAVEVDPLSGQPLKIGERSEKGVTPTVKLEALPI